MLYCWPLDPWNASPSWDHGRRWNSWRSISTEAGSHESNLMQLMQPFNSYLGNSHWNHQRKHESVLLLCFRTSLILMAPNSLMFELWKLHVPYACHDITNRTQKASEHKTGSFQAHNSATNHCSALVITSRLCNWWTNQWSSSSDDWDTAAHNLLDRILLSFKVLFLVKCDPESPQHWKAEWEKRCVLSDLTGQVEREKIQGLVYTSAERRQRDHSKGWSGQESMPKTNQTALSTANKGPCWVCFNVSTSPNGAIWSAPSPSARSSSSAQSLRDQLEYRCECLCRGPIHSLKQKCGMAINNNTRCTSSNPRDSGKQVCRTLCCLWSEWLPWSTSVDSYWF